MDLEKLKYFLTVVEQGTVSKAAKVLNMTQPPLSISIRKFEEELNLTLFERKGKRLKLTQTGKLLYERGKDLIISTEAIMEEAREKELGKSGVVTIGCSTIANLTIIPEVVEKINKQGLNIIIRVLEGNAAFVSEQLRLHQMDIGLIRNIIDKDDLHITALLKEPLYVAIPPSHPLKNRKSVFLNELKSEQFLMPYTTLGHGISDFILDGCQSYGFSPKIIYWGTDTLPMLNMVNKGLGIAFVPHTFTKIQGFRLPILLRLKKPEIHANLNLVTSRDNIKKAVTEIFLEATKEVIDSYNSEFL